MIGISSRIGGRTRMWLETPSPPCPDAPAVVRACDDCPTWCIGADKVEAVDRLAEHRRRCHG